MGSRKEQIQNILQADFSPQHLEVENESHQHSVPAGSETHFRVLIVSDRFEGLGRVQRQRQINDALKNLFSTGLHALSLRTLSPQEWAKGLAENFESPNCHGGGKK